jgi:hypothetical protein
MLEVMPPLTALQNARRQAAEILALIDEIISTAPEMVTPETEVVEQENIPA